MKKIAKVTLILLLFLAVIGCSKEASHEDSLSRIKKQGYFIVGLDDEFPPMGFRGENSDEIVGFDIDLAREAAKRLGVDVQFKPVAWDGIIFSLNKGDIDVVWNGMTITEERKQKINFSKPYMNNRQIVMVHADSDLTALDQLKGKIIGLQLGSSSEKALNSNSDLASSLKEVKKYENNALTLLDLAAKRVDAVVIDEIVGRYNMTKKPGVYSVLKEDLGREEYGVGIRKDDETFRKALDEVLDEIKSDEAGEAISQKWFAENIFKK